MKKGRGLNMGSGAFSRLETQPEFNEDLPEPMDGKMARDIQSEIPEDHQNEDYRFDYQDREVPQMQMMDHPGSQYGEDMLPPEPPRMDEMMQMRPEPPMAEPDLFDRIDTNHDGQITRDEYSNYMAPSRSMSMQQPPPLMPTSPGPIDFGSGALPGTGSMRIPGLDEPNLLKFSGLMPGTPDLLSQIPMQPGQNMFLPTGDPLGSSQPQVLPPFQTSMSPPATFQTQLPTTFSTQPPVSAVGVLPTSVQLRPGAPAVSQPFFTQLARR